jgi:hypothetical protein
MTDPRSGASTSDFRWERYTPAARHMVTVAQKEARAAGCSEIWPQHLLLGVLADVDSDATHIVARLGLRARDLRAAPSTKGTAVVVGRDGYLPFAPATAQLLRSAETFSADRGLPSVGTEHVLLAFTIVFGRNGGPLFSATGVEDLAAEISGAAAHAAPSAPPPVATSEPSALSERLSRLAGALPPGAQVLGGGSLQRINTMGPAGGAANAVPLMLEIPHEIASLGAGLQQSTLLYDEHLRIRLFAVRWSAAPGSRMLAMTERAAGEAAADTQPIPESGEIKFGIPWSDPDPPVEVLFALWPS